jgi:hypothetical protein
MMPCWGLGNARAACHSSDAWPGTGTTVRSSSSHGSSIDFGETVELKRRPGATLATAEKGAAASSSDAAAHGRVDHAAAAHAVERDSSAKDPKASRPKPGVPARLSTPSSVLAPLRGGVAALRGHGTRALPC